MEKLAEIKSSADECILSGSAFFLYCPDGYGCTKFNNAFLEARLQTSATTRNRRTVRKLLKLATER